MKMFLGALIGFGLATALSAQVTIENVTYPNASVKSVHSASAIVARSAVSVASGADVKFRSQTAVILQPGFSVASGGAFRASIVNDSDGDGMDDDWEVEHGLNPTNPADAATVVGNDLTYLDYYRLGLNPLGSPAIETGDTNTPALQIHRPTK
ncbi:MAG: hypothetical protein KBC32_07830 [Candidatus Didemnitutus sp.]|nr:hypothetical protein [Candidatus Didemnitutus sp.]